MTDVAGGGERAALIFIHVGGIIENPRSVNLGERFRSDEERTFRTVAPR